MLYFALTVFGLVLGLICFRMIIIGGMLCCGLSNLMVARRRANIKFHPRIRPRGFTLIELLVVIAIIVILAAILFPVFA